MTNTNQELLTVGLAQLSSVWLNKKATTQKIITTIEEAAEKGCQLVVFGEALLPGYPFWIELTDGAKFNSSIQKELHAFYVNQAVQIQAGDLDPICTVCKEKNITAVIGSIELAAVIFFSLQTVQIGSRSPACICTAWFT